jgi:hypothetical protein
MLGFSLYRWASWRKKPASEAQKSLLRKIYPDFETQVADNVGEAITVCKSRNLHTIFSERYQSATKITRLSDPTDPFQFTDAATRTSTSKDKHDDTGTNP